VTSPEHRDLNNHFSETMFTKFLLTGLHRFQTG